MSMSKTLLIVEDEFSLQKLYQQSFQDDGYQVVLARNGVEAIEKIQSGEKIDLAIFDIRMDKMDGLEAMGRINQMGLTFPMIINTAYPEYRQDFKSWAAQAFFIKSGDLTELKQKVKELLGDAGTNG